MVHRKESHTQSGMFKCRDFMKGICTFNVKECWYSHDDKNGEIHQQNIPFFQKAQDNPHPPDLMERLISMMEKLTKKVDVLEKTVQNNQ